MPRLIQSFSLIFSLITLMLVGLLTQTRESDVGAMRISYHALDTSTYESEIVIMDMNGREIHHLNSMQKLLLDYGWSADGQALFALTAPLNSLVLQIEHFGVNGKQSALLQEEFVVGAHNLELQETPIQEWIAFDGFDANFQAGIFVVSTQGKGLRNILRPGQYGEGFAISPDGQWIAYSVYDPNAYGMFIAPLGDATTPPQHIHEWSGEQLSWSPDGKWIYSFNYFIDGGSDTSKEWLNRISIDGTDYQLVHEIELDSPPNEMQHRTRHLQWSPDGQWLYWVRCEPTCEIVKMKGDGSNIHLTPIALPDISNIRISPDGQWFVLNSDLPGNDSGEIFVMREDGSDLRQLTNHPNRYDYAPQWSPVGIDKPWHWGYFIALGIVSGGLTLIARKVFR